MKVGQIIDVWGTITKYTMSTPKEEYKALNYLFLRNTLNAKELIVARNAIMETIMEDFKDIENVDRFKVISEDKRFIDFLEEETDVKLFTITLESIADKEFDIEIVTQLINLGVIIP